MSTKDIKKEFKKKFGRDLRKTSIAYIKDGSLAEVFKKQKEACEKRGLTMWGFEKVERLTKKVLKNRIRLMKENIEKGVWSGRQLRFAKHMLASLIRKLASI